MTEINNIHDTFFRETMSHIENLVCKLIEILLLIPKYLYYELNLCTIGLLMNTVGVFGLGFIVKYTQCYGPVRGGTGKPSDKKNACLNFIFWTLIILGFILQILESFKNGTIW